MKKEKSIIAYVIAGRTVCGRQTEAVVIYPQTFQKCSLPSPPGGGRRPYDRSKTSRLYAKQNFLSAWRKKPVAPKQPPLNYAQHLTTLRVRTHAPLLRRRNVDGVFLPHILFCTRIVPFVLLTINRG